MYNFEYQNPVKIIFGKGEIQKVGSNIPAGAKILLTYGGGSIFKNGVYDQVKSAIQGFEVVEFGGIEPNPHYETLMKAPVVDTLPIGAVLTLPATGSEMNGTAVITRVETTEKLAFATLKVMPLFSVLDPEVIFSLPAKQVANGIVDAFVHVIEQLTMHVHWQLFCPEQCTSNVARKKKSYYNSANAFGESVKELTRNELTRPFKKRRFKIGEKADIGPAEIRVILEHRL